MPWLAAAASTWEGSATFRWQGSTHFQGNVGHALWELRQRSRTPDIFYYQNHERFCGHRLRVNGQTRFALAAVTMAGLIAPVAGCRSGDSETASTTKTTAPTPEAVTFEGREVEGTLYLSAGQDSLNQDLYRARGSLNRVERLTKNGRISTITARGSTVVVSDARGSGSDRLEVADLNADDALPGRLIDPHGQGPDLSDGGKLLYSVPQYTDDGGDAGEKHFVTTPEPGARKRLALRTHSGDHAGWAPGEAVGLLRRGAGALVVRPGTPAERTIDSGFKRTRFGFLTSSRGHVLFYGPGGKIAVVAPGGERRVIDSAWQSLGAWSPDASSLLVKRGHRIGRMSVKDGSVTELGRVRNGQVFEAEWVPEEAP